MATMLATVGESGAVTRTRAVEDQSNVVREPTRICSGEQNLRLGARFPLAVRINVLNAIGKMDSEESLEMLRKLTNDSHETVRNECLRYLKLRTGNHFQR